jgi:putative hydrolase of the HAD superfamily
MNIVFDFGGVLFRWQPHEFLARLIPQRTQTSADTQALIADFFEGFAGDWGEFDRGMIEAGPLADRIAARTGLALADVRGVIDAIPHELEPLHDTVALLHRLHEASHALYFCRTCRPRTPTTSKRTTNSSHCSGPACSRRA